ncbi:class A beta-lactamase [Halomonas sp. HNIBRBA4712]|uniref:class A beta-lactamase n=1 Tax=Halomonas sp. HNIBRBA4712 TaxID=3373087 RepID=UPI00374623A8
MYRSILMALALSTPLMSLADSNTPVIDAVERTAAELDARVGFAAHDLQTGQRWAYNADHRFALSSTFKTLACADLLYRVDKGERVLDEEIVISREDLVTYSPVTEHRVDESMTLDALCEATLTTSDNTAANLILQALGGPGAVTALTRVLGDDTTRLDRFETQLNEAQPGDIRDTTTPNAMVHNLTELLLGDTLSRGSREQLREWLVGNQVADDLFRASLPDGWVIADRTGAGGFGSRSITAVIWPPEREPLVVAFYITETGASFEARNEAISRVGAALVEAIQAAQ